MLEYLRNAADKPFAKFLMFVLIFSFVGWGAAEWIFGGVTTDTTLIHVGDAEVSLQQFNNERSQELAAMPKEEQRAAYTDPVKSAELTKNVISRLTMNQLLTNRAKDLGFVVSDKRIADEIRSNPQFQANGEFAPWMYEIALQNSGVSEQNLADALRGNILRDMVSDMVSKPLAVPQFAVDAAYKARYAKRDIKYMTVDFSDFKVGEPNEEDLKAYYAQHPKIVPEVRSISYVFVATDMSKPDLYDEGFKQSQQIEDLIISGETMKDAAEKNKAKYVQVKAIKRGDELKDKVLTDDLVAKLFSMEMGVESELLELKDGFVILRVDSIDPEHNADFKDVKKDLVSGWKKSEQRKKAYIQANEYLIKLNEGKSLKSAKSASVSRTEGAPIEILNSAFAGHDGDNSIVEDKNAFYVLHIDKTIMPKEDKKKQEALRKELESMQKSYVSDDYSQFLKRHYPVKVNDKTFKKFIAK